VTFSNAPDGSNKNESHTPKVNGCNKGSQMPSQQQQQPRKLAHTTSSPSTSIKVLQQ
jgi:hypothetical protein